MKTKFIFFGLLILAGIILIARNFSDQGVGPHGGVMEKSGNYVIEAESRYPTLCVYLYDHKMKAIGNSGITCRAEFLYGDNATMEKIMRSMGTEGFSAEMPAVPYYSCKVIFNVYGKEVSAKFPNQNPIAKEK